MNRPACRILLLAAPLFAAGCYHPYQWPLRPPGYMPPQQYAPRHLTPGAPGSLVIPPSNAPLYEPGSSLDSDSSPSTYEYDEDSDDWNSGSSGEFYEDDVPKPQEPRGGSGFDDDFHGAGRAPVDSTIAGAVSNKAQYGFDQRDYRWLRGILRFSETTDQWSITYNLNEDDRHGGILALITTPTQRKQFRRGSTVEVAGRLAVDELDADRRPMYRVATVEPINLQMTH